MGAHVGEGVKRPRAVAGQEDGLGERIREERARDRFPDPRQLGRPRDDVPRAGEHPLDEGLRPRRIAMDRGRQRSRPERVGVDFEAGQRLDDAASTPRRCGSTARS